MSKTDFTILVCCHKKDFYYNGVGYLPIQVGKVNSAIDLEICGDDSGKNISAKNPNFCELTAQYWLWQQLPTTPYVGLNHYRRYFDYKRRATGSYFFQNLHPANIKDGTLDIPENLDEVFKEYDIILAEPMTYPYSLFIQYSITHNKTDLAKLRNTIKNLYPEYVPTFDEVMRSNRCSLCNMFIMRRNEFEKYSEWLFNILLKLEDKISIPKDSYQSRIFGFMAERLLNVYVRHNKLKPKYYPILMISDAQPLNRIKGYLKNKLYNLSFSIIANSDNGKVRM